MRFPLEGYRSALLSRSLPVLVISALLSVLGAASLTGCGVGTLANSVPQVAQVIPAFSGTMMGGQSPIVNATIKIYATGSDGNCTSAGSVGACSAGDIGYGVGTLLQEATSKTGTTGQDTDANGSFSFAGGYFCPAGEFVYLVGSGGNPGSATNTANSNILLVAALGRCEDLYTQITGGYQGYKSTNIYLNEVTTVAAGYALGNFATVTNSGSPSTTQVLIGAPSTNNAPQNGSGISTGTTTAAAGLYHAFLDAANLANPFSTSVLATAPSTTTAGGTVPAALINTIANILANCVDTGAGGGGQCSNLPGGADTFTAVKMLAANPTLGGSGTAVSNLFNNVGPVGPFSPALTAAPNDFSIAINYPSSAFTAISFPMSGALDANDDFFVGNATYNTASHGNPTSPVNILAFTSNGNYSSSSTFTSLTAAYSLAMDANGKGYIGNGGGSGTYALGIFTTSSGTVSTVSTGGVVTTAHTGNLKAYALAVDQANDLWAFGVKQTNGTSNLYMSPGGYTAGAATFVAQSGPGSAATATALTLPGDNIIGLAIDPNQNVWTTAVQTVYVTENICTTPCSTPTYAASTVAPTSASATGNTVSGIAFTGTAAATKAWIPSYNTTPGVQLFTPTYDANAVGVASLAGSSTIAQPATVTGTLFTEADGSGTVWLADTNSASIQAFNPNSTTPSSSTAYRFLPCMVSGTTCSTVFSYKPLSLSIDSTGSIWVTVAASGSANTTASPGNIVQIIGSAAPTWPLLSLGKLGKP